jgi:hypothetical protein
MKKAKRLQNKSIRKTLLMEILLSYGVPPKLIAEYLGISKPTVIYRRKKMKMEQDKNIKLLPKPVAEILVKSFLQQ